jgi:cytochrome c oxidase assembly protein subunit 15
MLDRFQKLALATTGATYLLIAVGGLVRAAGAGLGCPDWPRCFDRWVPPLDASGVPPHIDPALFNFAKAWTEYLNRLLGVVVGVLILATLVAAWRRHRRAPRVLWPTVAAFVLVLFEGWLGGMVVRSQLRPLVLTAHLTFALVVASLLLLATFSAFFPGGRPGPTTVDRRRVERAALATLALSLLQVGVGAAVRGEVQALAATVSDRGAWLPAVGMLDVVHRNLGVAVTAAALALAPLAARLDRPDPRLRLAVHASAALVVAQVAAGLGLAYLGFPRALQVLHLWFGSLLLAALTVAALLARRPAPAPGSPVPG